MPTEFTLPDLGENIESGDVVSVMVAIGDTLAEAQPVIELATAKAGGEASSGVSTASLRVALDESRSAEEALRIGLVNEVVPHDQLLERAEAMARHIVEMPPVAVRMMKEFVVRFGDLPTDQAWHVQNLMNNLLIQNTADGEEGRRAFNEKRKPNFTGALRKRGEPFDEVPEEDWDRLDEIYRSGEY